MFQSERLASLGVAARRRPNGLVASILWVAGLIAANQESQGTGGGAFVGVSGASLHPQRVGSDLLQAASAAFCAPPA